MNSRSSGILSYRPSVKAAERAIDFVYRHLPIWRDHPERPAGKSENKLTESLAKYLNDEARHGDQPFLFFHQPSAGGRRTVDFSAVPYGTANNFAKPAITVFEAKRLPAPERRREREYVVGVDRPSGGIQRFKLGRHGSGFPLAAMVGYVQKGTPADWLNTINSWIAELAGGLPVGGSPWDRRERLENLGQNAKTHTAHACSRHCRIDESDIVIRHLWVVMN